jgi:F420H(2)-dependent quinone reductase
MQQTTSQPRGSLGGQHGPIWGFLMHRAINPVMRRLLSSRFHRQIGSEMITVLTFRGRKSGKEYTFPIGYMQEGSDLICYSPFGWWTNLRGGAPVTVTLRGQRIGGHADICTDTATIASGMAAYLRHNPGDAFFFRVKLRDGEQVAADVERAARENVQIRIALPTNADVGGARTRRHQR